MKINIFNKFIILVIIPLCVSCTKVNRNKNTDRRFTEVPPKLDSFLNSIPANKQWIEKKNPDSFGSFSQLKDTYYIRKLDYSKLPIISGYGTLIDTVCILFNQPRLSQPQLFVNNTILNNLQDYDNKFTTVITHPVFISDTKLGKPDSIAAAIIDGVFFKSDAYFGGNMFNSFILLKDDIFNNLNFIHYAIKKYSPYFLKCEFHKGIIFNIRQFGHSSNSRFRSDLNFMQCIITGNLDLSYSSFENCKLNLLGTTLPDTLDLSYAKLSDIIDLTSAYPNINNAKCEINVLNTDIDKLLLKYNNFHLYIPDSIRKNPQTRDLVSSTYELLLNNFKKHSFVDSYEKLDIEYKEWQGNIDWTYKISDIWWKFGYQKWRILLFTIGFIFLFSTYNYHKYRILQSVYPIERLKWANIQYSPIRFLYILRKFFAVYLYTGLIFFRLSIDFKNLNFRPMRYVALIIFEYTIGLVCTGFLINWILKG